MIRHCIFLCERRGVPKIFFGYSSGSSTISSGLFFSHVESLDVLS